jgi:3',5'-cyclic AMP phosphodiesterase CpdA
MLIAQLTDIHLGYELDNPDEANVGRFDVALNWLKNLSVQPDMLFMSGDLTDHGDIASYEKPRDRIADLPFPVYLCVGNHDDRKALKHVFPHIPTADGFVGPEVQKAMHDSLDNHPKVTLHDYEGLDHGFAATSGNRRNEAGAQLADSRTEAFFAQHLA